MNAEGAEHNLKVENKEDVQGVSPHFSFGQAFRFWVKLGFISFGGPVGQISVMHHELVEQKKWVGNERF